MTDPTTPQSAQSLVRPSSQGSLRKSWWSSPKSPYLGASPTPLAGSTRSPSLRSAPKEIVKQLRTDFICWETGNETKVNVALNMSSALMDGRPSDQTLRPLPFLDGIHQCAEDRNQMVKKEGKKIQQIQAQTPGTPAKKMPRMTVMKLEDSGDENVMAPEEFDQIVSDLATSASDIFKMQQDFSPGAAKARQTVLGKDGRPSVSPSKRASLTSAKKGDEDEDEEDQAFRERMEKYRWVRKIEPDVPPLDRNKMKDFKPKDTPDHIVKRNQQKEVIELYRPESRKDQRHALQDMARNRFMDNRCRYFYQLMDAEESFSRDLERKRNQVSLEKGQQVRWRASYEGAGLWLTTMIAIGVITALRDEHKFQQMSTDELMKLGREAEELVRRQSKKRDSGVAQMRKMVRRSTLLIRAMNMNNIYNNAELMGNARLIATMFQAKVRLRVKRRHATTMWTSMAKWKRGGKVLLGLKRFHQRMRRIQKWWRQILRYWHANQDRILSQWKRIERAQLFAEMGRGGMGSADGDGTTGRRASRDVRPPANTFRKTRTGPDTSLSVDEKVMLAMMDDKQRRNFLERELRARRYHLLPRIYDWEDGMRRFWLDLAEWRETKIAVAAMTHTDGSFDLQRVGPMPWPPPRPVCTPKEDELVEIVTRARKDPEDVTHIAHVSGKKGGARRSTKRGVKSGARDDDADVGVTDRELRQCWGIDLDEMPGLNPGNLRLNLVRAHRKD